MKYTYSIGSFKRIENSKPLRSFKEMYEEFGVTRHCLTRLMCHEGAPKPKIKVPSNTYYDPDEMRKWWKSINLNKEMK